MWATRFLPKGWVLPYGGELVRDIVCDMRYPHADQPPEYVFEVSAHLRLDANCKRGIGSMLNQPPAGKRACGQFDKWSMDHQLRAAAAGIIPPEDVCSVLFVLTRNVKAETELFASYGNKAWTRNMHAKPRMHAPGASSSDEQ